VLFELISERYERKSIVITANTPFSQWDEVFVDAAMTVAAVGRLVHHSTILEMNVESYRRRAAQAAKAPARKTKLATTTGAVRVVDADHMALGAPDCASADMARRERAGADRVARSADSTRGEPVTWSRHLRQPPQVLVGWGISRVVTTGWRRVVTTRLAQGLAWSRALRDCSS